MKNLKGCFFCADIDVKIRIYAFIIHLKCEKMSFKRESPLVRNCK